MKLGGNGEAFALFGYEIFRHGGDKRGKMGEGQVGSRPAAFLRPPLLSFCIKSNHLNSCVLPPYQNHFNDAN